MKRGIKPPFMVMPVTRVVATGETVHEKCPYCGEDVIVIVHSKFIETNCCAHASVSVRSIQFSFEGDTNAVDS